MLVGGGVKTPESAKSLVSSGAGYIVAGALLEDLPPLKTLCAFTQAIHTS